MPMRMHSECRCCKAFLHHCRNCWNKYHNGEKDNDYIPPKYYGESMDEEITTKIEKITRIKRSIQPNKDQPYTEMCYPH